MTPWTAARQAPLPMGFSRQGYWSGLPCPPPGDLPNPGIEPGFPVFQVDSLLCELHQGSINPLESMKSPTAHGPLELWVSRGGGEQSLERGGCEEQACLPPVGLRVKAAPYSQGRISEASGADCPAHVSGAGGGLSQAASSAAPWWVRRALWPPGCPLARHCPAPTGSGLAQRGAKAGDLGLTSVCY